MYDGYVNKHRPQDHFPGNDKNMNKNKRLKSDIKQSLQVYVFVCA